jgi:hypothetical protein
MFKRRVLLRILSLYNMNQLNGDKEVKTRQIGGVGIRNAQKIASKCNAARRD